MYVTIDVLTTSNLSVFTTTYKTHSRSSKVKSVKRETESVKYIQSSLMFILNVLYDFV
jgi:hypothetical protein